VEDETIIRANTIVPASFQRSNNVRRIKWSERRKKEDSTQKAKMKAEMGRKSYQLVDKNPPAISNE
jgi:hypothetical protein